MEFIGPNPGSPEYDEIYGKLDKSHNPMAEIYAMWYGLRKNKTRPMEYCGPPPVHSEYDDEVDGEYLYKKCKKVRKRLDDAVTILYNLIAGGKISPTDAQELDTLLRKTFAKLSNAMNKSVY